MSKLTKSKTLRMPPPLSQKTKKNIVRIVYHQGKVFRRFKEKEKFIKLAKQFKVHKTRMIIKINIIKLT